MKLKVTRKVTIQKKYVCDLHLERRLAGFDPDPVESPAHLWLPGNPAFDSELTREVGKGQTDKNRDDPLTGKKEQGQAHGDDKNSQEILCDDETDTEEKGST